MNYWVIIIITACVCAICLRMIILYYKNRLLIPRKIIQTGKSPAKSDSRLHKAAETWKKLNPEYTYEFFNDKQCASFIKKHFHTRTLEAFHTLKPGAFKADLFRYCYLYIHGGVYCDMDTEPYKPLRDIIPSNAHFVASSEREIWVKVPAIYQAFIACEPKLPFLLNAIERITINAKTRFYPVPFRSNDWNQILSITGPVLLSNAMNGTHKKGWHKIHDKNIYLLELLNGYDIINPTDNEPCICSKVAPVVSPISYGQMYADRDVYIM